MGRQSLHHLWRKFAFDHCHLRQRYANPSSRICSSWEQPRFSALLRLLAPTNQQNYPFIQKVIEHLLLRKHPKANTSVVKIPIHRLGCLMIFLRTMYKSDLYCPQAQKITNRLHILVKGVVLIGMCMDQLPKCF